MYVKSNSEEPKNSSFVSLIKLLRMSLMRGIYCQRQLCCRVKGNNLQVESEFKERTTDTSVKYKIRNIQCNLKFMRNGTALPAMVEGQRSQLDQSIHASEADY